MSKAEDTGTFGPDSISWQVLREASVMIGGVRALLMHAAHPLVVAGARQTRMYEYDPWHRLERTLRLTFAQVFGTREEAAMAARRIDQIHRGIKGTDPITGLCYDARDPDLLLWVHASLVTSFLLMERLTIGRLNAVGRQRFHEEMMLTVEPLGLPLERIPRTVEALDSYVENVLTSGILRVTDGSSQVAKLVRCPPDGVPRRRVWRLVSFLAFHSLPPSLRDLYGVCHRPWHEARLQLVTSAMRLDRPLMPPRLRFTGPAILAGARLRGESVRIVDAPIFIVRHGSRRV